MLTKYKDKMKIIHYPGNEYELPVQCMILQHFMDNFLRNDEITHVIHIDIDEFIVLKKHNNICDFINEYITGDCQGIAISWRHFGSSGNLEKTNEPVTTRFTMCENKGTLMPYVKILFKTENFIQWTKGHWTGNKWTYSCHHIDVSKGYVSNTLNFRPKIIIKDYSKIDFSVIQLNHYKCKTYPEFKYIRTRNNADFCKKDQKVENVDANFKFFNVNEIEDLTCKNFYLSIDK